MTTPELMNAQAKKFLNDSRKNEIGEFVVDIEKTKKEISKLKDREERYTNICSEGIITNVKLKEYLDPIRKEMSALETSFAQATAHKPKSEILLPTIEEIELFSKEAKALLEEITVGEGLNFAFKKGIIIKADMKIISTQRDLMVHGTLNLQEIYVKLFTERRNCWAPKCREVHIIQNINKKAGFDCKLSFCHN